MPVPARFLPAALLLVGLALTACAARDGVSQTEPIAAINVERGLALKGHDAVAYFTAHKPVPGVAAFSHRWHGVTWQFATAAHRDAFAATPERYAPQYGGYCAFAISRGLIADIDPQAWAIEGGRLYLNNNAFAHQLWDADRPGNIAAGDRNWPRVPKLPDPGA